MNKIVFILQELGLSAKSLSDPRIVLFQGRQEGVADPVSQVDRLTV